ncbi:MAG: hypothetical protein ACE5Q6_11165 [Dehalococcoidia bacterium]
MAATVFAVPLAPGKTEAWKQAVAEMTSSRKNDYVASRASLGITKETVALQETPHGDMVVVYMEANDVTNILQRMIDSNSSFDQWFKQTILADAHGLDLSQPAPPANPIIADVI